MSIDTHAKQTDKLEFSPSEDGISHINVYTRGATVLGRGLSNLSDCNIEHPYFGHFRTLEGLWYYMKTGFKDDTFRIVKGLSAREQGKKMPSAQYPLFNKMFKLGMLEKLDRNQNLQHELINNDLPLAHYYVYGTRVHQLNHHQWQLDYWMLLRQALITSGKLDIIRDELVKEIQFHMDSPDGLMARSESEKTKNDE